MSESAAEVRKFSKVYCPHCKKDVSKSTYYDHYSKFYNKESRSWQLMAKQPSTSNEPDFDFGKVEVEEATVSKEDTCLTVQTDDFMELVTEIDDDQASVDYDEAATTQDVSIIFC